MFNKSKPNRVAVVTGGSAGVGRETVKLLASAGYNVAIVARGIEGLEATRKEVEALGKRALIFPLDVANYHALDAAATEIEDQLGPIDLWINNAFVAAIMEFNDLDVTEFDRITDVTYKGTVNGTRVALERMRPRNSGTIIQVGSALSFRGMPLLAAYCGAKHAIKGFSEALRAELLTTKINICQVYLPGINTPFYSWALTNVESHPHPFPPAYEPIVAARAILDVVRRPRRSLMVEAPTYFTYWTNAFLPGLTDQILARIGAKLQQSPTSGPPTPTSNLFTPVDSARAKGDFSKTSSSFAPVLWLSTHPVVRRSVLIGIIALLRAKSKR